MSMNILKTVYSFRTYSNHQICNLNSRTGSKIDLIALSLISIFLSKCIVEMSEERGQCSIRRPDNPDQPPKHFTFDGAYFTDSTTEQIYNDIAYPLVEVSTSGLLASFNCEITCDR